MTELERLKAAHAAYYTALAAQEKEPTDD